MTPTGTNPTRRRNPRGQGHRLREEIVAGAAALIELTGTEQSVTLRAVARQIGIAAPSIAPHFADPTEIIDAVVATELDTLTQVLHEAAASTADPVEALLATSRAYVSFGRAHPNRYRVIFERRFLDIWDENRPMPQTGPVMARNIELSVGLVQACIDAGRSTSTDAYAEMTAIWMFLHGLITLTAAITSVPWPDTDETLTNSVSRIARIQPSPRPRRRSTPRS